MLTAEDKNLRTIEQELRFIARQSQQIVGSYEVVDEINFAIVSALRELEEHRLSLQSACDEIATGVPRAA
jgi:hypothetical protein